MQFSPPRKKSQPGSIRLRKLQEEKHFVIVLTLFSPVPFSRRRRLVVVPPDDSSSNDSFQIMKINQWKAPPVLPRKILARRILVAGLTNNHHWSYKTHGSVVHYQNNLRLRRRRSSLLAVCSYFQEHSNRQHQQWWCLRHMNRRRLWVQFWCPSQHMRPLKM